MSIFIVFMPLSLFKFLKLCDHRSWWIGLVKIINQSIAFPLSISRPFRSLITFSVLTCSIPLPVKGATSSENLGFQRISGSMQSPDLGSASSKISSIVVLKSFCEIRSPCLSSFLIGKSFEAKLSRRVLAEVCWWMSSKDFIYVSFILILSVLRLCQNISLG